MPSKFHLWKDVTDDQTNDWKRQPANRITAVTQLKQVINLTGQEESVVKNCLKSLRMNITPHYAMLDGSEEKMYVMLNDSVLI